MPKPTHVDREKRFLINFNIGGGCKNIHISLTLQRRNYVSNDSQCHAKMFSFVSEDYPNRHAGRKKTLVFQCVIKK